MYMAAREKQTEYRQKNAEDYREKYTEYNEKTKDTRKTQQAKTREEKRMLTTEEIRFSNFKKDQIHGPNFVCFSCHRTLFIKQVKILKTKELTKLFDKVDHEFLKNEVGIDKEAEELILCHKCHNWINCKNWKLPNIHWSNGLELDEVPEELDIKDLEQQLIAKVLIFQKIKKLPTSRMRANFDRVISVPIGSETIGKTISKLPRHPDDANIVAVQLKRKLEMKNSHLEQYIRPKHLPKTLKKLKDLGHRLG